MILIKAFKEDEDDTLLRVNTIWSWQNVYDTASEVTFQIRLKSRGKKWELKLEEAYAKIRINMFSEVKCKWRNI